MYRNCRAGRNAWQLVSGPSRPLQGQGAAVTPTTTTKQLRRFASETSPDGVPPTDTASQASEDAANAAEGAAESTAEAAAPPPITGGRGRAARMTVRKDPNILGPKVIFSGIQPTGVPHLGNYLGALREWKRLQDTAHPATKLLFCIVDMHAITVPRPPGELYENRMKMLAALLAVGINPERSTIFFQSSVPYHAELQWILSCTASVGYLSRMTQWKSKMQLGDNASLDDAKKTLKHGLFSYPILQAADILIHRATHVPVGDDQRQHLEFARECVTNFNHTYATDCLVAPQTLVSPSKRVMSLTNPLQKMSKSDPSPKSHILLTDSREQITKKLMQALTDPTNAVSYDPDWRAGVANLLEILSAFDAEGRSAAQLGEALKGEKIAELKHQVARAVDGELAGVRERYEDFVCDRKRMEDIVGRSTAWAKSNAGNTMGMVKQAMGLMLPLKMKA